MKILLIHIHNMRRIRFNLSGVFPVFPLGIAYLSSWFRRHGFKTELLDLSIPEHRRIPVGEKIKNEDYLFIGLSATVFSLLDAKMLARTIKGARTDLPVVLGGPGTVFSPESLSRHLPEIDIYTFGEGELILEALARALESGRTLGSVPGIAYRLDGKLIVNSPPPFLDLNDLTLPDRRGLPHHRYKMHPPFNLYPPFTIMETSRGCNYNCNFCSLPRPARFRSARHILEEIDDLVGNFSVREIHFVDPIFTVSRDRTIELAESLARREYDLRWTFKTRSDLVDSELLKLLKAAGCYMISYGIESGSKEMLDAMNKDYSVEANRHALEETKKAGIRIMAYILYGLPGESRHTIKETLKLLKETRPDYALFAPLYPDPASTITKEAWRRDPSIIGEIEDFYYYRKQIKRNMSIFGIPMNKLRLWISLSYLWYYFTPYALIKRGFQINNLRDVWNLFKGGWELFWDLILPGRGL